jgi:uncharacterized coiled-coil protein SlyX
MEMAEEEKLCNWIDQRTNTPRSRSMGNDTVEVDTERRLVRLENVLARRWGNIESINLKLEDNWAFVGELLRTQMILQRRMKQMQLELEGKMSKKEDEKTKHVEDKEVKNKRLSK